MEQSKFKEENLEVSILGTKYSIVFASSKDNEYLEDAEGRCDSFSHKIFVRKVGDPESAYPIDAQKVNQKLTIRHEILHAFLAEAGLEQSSLPTESWAVNEEMVDWFAHMWPKIQKVFEKIGV